MFSSGDIHSTGDAGNLTINTNDLTVQNGAKISVGTEGLGKVGTININANNLIQLLGNRLAENEPLDPATDVTFIFSSLFANVLNINNKNDAGNVEINTGKFLVQAGARVSVDNEGLGKGGNININANSILLDNAGNSLHDAGGIQATTKSGEGGNITLQIKDILLMRNGSKITTDATGGNGNGGNITISANLLASAENSDITANAIQGQGGTFKLQLKVSLVSNSANNSLLKAILQLVLSLG